MSLASVLLESGFRSQWFKGRMFYCRCFSFLFQEVEEIEHESRAQTKSTSNQTYYSASSDFSSLENLRVFTFAELKAATNNFSSALKIGDGRYGSVHRGFFGQNLVAVKYTKVTKEHKEWVDEVNLLGLVDHPNLVKLVGYCVEENESGMQRILVHRFMPNRSVRDHLSTSSKAPLSWTMRKKVAQDAARGLAYLHEGMDTQMVFRDFSSSRLLLDGRWDAKLSDFGVAQIGSQGDIGEFIGTVAYAAPEYIKTGLVSSKSDVWSYGVFLYELITGRHPLDRNLPVGEQKLLEWVRPYVDSKNLKHIIDPRLEASIYSLKSVEALAIIADLCLKRDPQSRPNMSKVLEMVNRVIEITSQKTTFVPVLENSVPLKPRPKLLKS